MSVVVRRHVHDVGVWRWTHYRRTTDEPSSAVDLWCMGATQRPQDEGDDSPGAHLLRSPRGSIGVQIAQALVRTNTLALSGSEYAVTPHTAARLSAIGIDLSAVQAHARLTRRPLVRACLDRSERRYHVAGALGAALADYFLDQRWVERRRSSRALAITGWATRATCTF